MRSDNSKQLVPGGPIAKPLTKEQAIEIVTEQIGLFLRVYCVDMVAGKMPTGPKGQKRRRDANQLAKLVVDKIIGALVEGNSIRSTERMTDTHRDTVMRLMVEVGTGRAKLMDEQMRGLPCKRIRVDEIWAYVGKKQRIVTREDDKSRVGDQWTFVAIDAETKLVPCFRVGKRTKPHAIAFMGDLSERLANRVQLSLDALQSYVDAVEQAFGADVDYGQAVKFYEAEPTGPGRYSPPKVVRAERTAIAGTPDVAPISTSLVERQNLTMRRMSMRRFTRLTNAFSKKGREPSGGSSASFRALQLCAAASDASHDASNGGERQSAYGRLMNGLSELPAEG